MPTSVNEQQVLRSHLSTCCRLLTADRGGSDLVTELRNRSGVVTFHKRFLEIPLRVPHRSSLKSGPARKNTARVFKNLTTTDTHEFIQLFL